MNNNKIPRNIQNIKPYEVTINEKIINFCVIPFNLNLIRENENWKERNNYEGCIYSTPNKGLRHIKEKNIVFVFEANMEINEIIGMGIILKENSKKVKIYSDSNKNRYNYRGKYHFSKEELIKMNEEFVDNIEKMIFKSKFHLKRINGLSIISKRLMEINEKIRNLKIDLNSFSKKFVDYI